MTVLIVWSQKKNNCLKYWFFNNLISIIAPTCYTTRYSYNAQWLPEIVTDTYNTTAMTPWAEEQAQSF